ncbi:uncharacterized protein [Primulina huaijiensis]|uniref:uncharacterized protein n=1 Tax=Primulina huaijiensis TaxID=1492673 RepID=UPI003CC77964
MDSSKESGKANDEGGEEIKVGTVDYRTPAGRQEDPEEKTVEVTHVIHEGEKPGVVAGAAGKVAGAVHSAKEAVSGDKKKE